MKGWTLCQKEGKKMLNMTSLSKTDNVKIDRHITTRIYVT